MGDDLRNSLPRRPLLKRASAIALAMLVLVAAATIVGQPLQDDRDGPTPDLSPIPVALGPSPPNSRPVTGDSSRTQSGAVATATTFASIMAAPSGSVERYRAAMQVLAAPGWQERARELADNAAHFVASEYGLGGSLSFSPLLYRVKAFSQDSAAIELWGVVLASGPKIEGIRESWITATLRLVWTGGGWRVERQSSEPGPTPALFQTDPGREAETLKDFHEFGRGPKP